ncbi:methyl viologen resistance protein YddG [mine drainage metagenome]|uniref:Methyl viologen resistance protein YddG n=1 Tax=mine drainage metagenome TaxID=410659 RepID=A0A1J5QH78_9ZZZZ
MTGRTATLTGFIAVILWSLLALFTVGSAPVPPLQLNAICFAIGGSIGLGWTISRGRLHLLGDVDWRVYAFGTAGLFGYHALYFSALRMAPAAEAGLIAYLWPLLIVLFSGLLPGERLGRGHILGATIAFGGAALIVLRSGANFDGSALPGYGLAFLCALTWATYSVLSRKLGSVPTDSVAIFCLATAALSTVTHIAFEPTAWPVSMLGWLSCIALGVGPVGIAFYVWDIGVKGGDIQVLGVASYAAPLLSTLALIIAGITSMAPTIIVAAVLIASGAGVAAVASARLPAPPPNNDPIRPASGA